MNSLELQTEPENNDDNSQNDLMPNQVPEHARKCLRRYTRLPLKVFAAVATVYICVLSSERFFAYWVETCIECTDMHVSDISFPAVTICPSKTINTRGDESLAMVYNMAQEIMWPTAGGVDIDEKAYDNITLEYSNNLISNIIKLFNYTCEDLFRECHWRHQIVDCCSIFKSAGPAEGSCFAFNSIRSINPDPTWPWSVADSGSKSGLYIKLNRRFKDMTVLGTGIILHEPNQFLGNNIIYSTDDRIVIPVEPIRFTAEPEVKIRPVNLRRCLFTSELGIIGQSRSECISNCHMSYIAQTCNCTMDLPVPAWMLNEDDSFTHNRGNYRRCGVSDLKCLYEHRRSLFTISNIIEESLDNIFTTRNCGCFPNCNHVHYRTSTYTERLNTIENNGSYIEVDVYFQEETLFSYRSVLYFTSIDLLVSYGGIAGLILGCSAIGALNGLLNYFGCCAHRKTN